MKRNIGICIFVLFIVAIGVTVLMNNIDANSKEQHLKDETEMIDTEAMIKTNAEIESYKYYVGLLDDKVVVYNSDGNTIYLETEIYISQLPEPIIEKLRNKVGYKSIEEVFDLLESYSS